MSTVRKTDKILSRLPAMVGVLAIVFACSWMIGRCSRARESNFVQNRQYASGDTLNVAVERSPLLYAPTADSVSGLDYEIISHIASLHGLSVRFHPFVPLSFALEGLADGRFDVVMAAIPSTTEMREKYNMTDGVYLGRQVLVQRRDSAASRPHIVSQEQLAGHKVWIVEDSPYASRLANLGAELGDTVYVNTLPGYSAEHLCLLTANGEIPRAVVDETTARRIAADYPCLDVSVPVSFSQFQSWAVRRESLRDSFNIWLEEFRATDSYDSLLTSYGLK